MSTIIQFDQNGEPFAPITVDEAFDHFEEWMISKNYPIATIRGHQNSLKIFRSFFGPETPLAKINEREIDRYRSALVKRKLSPRTVNTYLGHAKNLFAWAVKKKYLVAAPEVEFAEIEKHPRPKPGLLLEEFYALLEACQHESTKLMRLRAEAIVRMLFDTGLRASELCNARWADIEEDEVDGEIAHVLIVQGAKGGGERIANLSPVVWEAINAYRNEMARPHGRGRQQRGFSPETIFVSHKGNKGVGKPLTTSGLRRICDRLERYSEIHANPHKFRRGWAIYWLNNEHGDRDIETLMQIGGWKDRETILRHYAHIEKKTLIRAHRRNAAQSNQRRPGLKAIT
jgi:integrase